MTTDERTMDQVLSDAEQREEEIKDDLALRLFAAPIRMVCGCMVTELSQVKQDAEGFIVCATHGERRYGWRSLPFNDGRAYYKYAGYTDLERERHFVFRDPLPDKTVELQPVEDQRLVWPHESSEEVWRAMCNIRNVSDSAWGPMRVDPATRQPVPHPMASVITPEGTLPDNLPLADDIVGTMGPGTFMRRRHEGDS